MITHMNQKPVQPMPTYNQNPMVQDPSSILDAQVLESHLSQQPDEQPFYQSDDIMYDLEQETKSVGTFQSENLINDFSSVLHSEIVVGKTDMPEPEKLKIVDSDSEKPTNQKPPTFDLEERPLHAMIIPVEEEEPEEPKETIDLDEIPISTPKTFEELLAEELAQQPESAPLPPENRESKFKPKKEFLKRNKTNTLKSKPAPKSSKYKYYTENFLEDATPTKSELNPKEPKPFQNTKSRSSIKSIPAEEEYTLQKNQKETPKEKKKFLQRGKGIGGGKGKDLTPMAKGEKKFQKKMFGSDSESEVEDEDKTEFLDPMD